MNSDCFSKLEIDAIGEILNISLGASATAVSTMLSARVDIKALCPPFQRYPYYTRFLGRKLISRPAFSGRTGSLRRPGRTAAGRPRRWW